MPVIRIIRRTSLAPAEVWERLTDWERHGAQVPLTRTIIETEPPTRVGTRFTARTGVGRITCDDPMEVVLWDPPRLVRIEKRGGAVTGWAEIELRPDPAGGTEVHWREDLTLPRLPHALTPLVTWTGRHLFTHALTRLLRQ
ncbi:SRPBCC family protein [Streptomyces sp. NBC_00091]|uniref:SRPBCC family protein n=1 Tax=Streptomyces sp. NBC_00091 TaxID=2975648 RepID=UPI00225624D7|nr:SRPBCC family protein [Streptomyces sp. NBC_00091]MCX5379674.1 SRPBCC family protein [Streptomyces sp. NBC_00091]